MYYIVSIDVTRYWQGDDVVHRLYNVGGSSLTARHSAVPTSLSCGMIGAGLDVCFLRQCFVGTHQGASDFVCRRVRIVMYSRVFTISSNAGVEPRRGDIIQHRVLTLCLYGIPAKRIGTPRLPASGFPIPFTHTRTVTQGLHPVLYYVTPSGFNASCRDDVCYAFEWRCFVGTHLGASEFTYPTHRRMHQGASLQRCL